MDTYTFMSEEGIHAVIASLPAKYKMELNNTDMIDLVSALDMAWNQGNEFAGQFVSAIANTLGIEFI